jgi:hypothetical protein
MRRFLACCLLMSSVVALAQAPPIKSEPQSQAQARTFGLINGRGWALLSEEGKTAYFVGLMDGWDARQGLAGDTTVAVILAMWTNDISLGNSVDLIDQGYKDPANIDLPVWWVFMAEVSIKRGDMSSDKAFTTLRHLLTQINVSTEVLSKDKFNERFSPINALTAAKTK